MTKFIESINLPAGLESRVLARLNEEQQRAAKFRLFVFALLDALSLLGLVASLVYLARVFAESGFSQYLSLLFSDGGSLLSYWRELVLSLAESLPALGLLAFLFVTLILIWSMAKTIINVRVLTMSI